MHVAHTREDRRQKCCALRRHEQEEDCALRLFQSLQKTVRRRLIHRVGIVHKDDEASREQRLSRGLLLNLAHGVDAQDAHALAAALGRRLNVVGMCTCEEGTARRANTARRILPAAQQSCGQEARHLLLAHAGDPRKEERMGQATVTQHGPQPMDIPFVPEDIPPGKRLLHHI